MIAEVLGTSNYCTFFGILATKKHKTNSAVKNIAEHQNSLSKEYGKNNLRCKSAEKIIK